jgi:hypothetical protein
MKKSEVVDYIVKNGRCQISEIQAEDVLRLIDELGFLPPRTQLNKLKLQDNGYDVEEELYGSRKL